MTKFRIFISYARENQKQAELLRSRLEEIDHKPWMDTEKINHGDNWEKKIKQNIHTYDFYIPLLSPISVKRKVESGFGFEIECAFRKSEKAPERRFILPIRIEECDTDDDRLKKLHWIDFFPNFDDGFNKLIETLNNESLENWDAIKWVAKKINDQTMNHRSKRYKRHPSIARKVLMKNVNEFLNSDKRIFVITGKSGVGKTTFIINLMKNLQHKKETCFFVFDARKIESISFIDFFNNKFLNHVQSLPDKYEDFKDRIGTINFIPYIKYLPIVHTHQLVFIIDAINELVNGKKILNDIDKMVGEFWPKMKFVKIILTSRPVAWKSILKNALPTSINQFYRNNDTGEETFFLTNFSIRTNDNELSETEEAYNQYKKRWNIRTSFHQLSDQVKKLLQNPLLMALVSEISKEGFIPLNINLDDIYLRYFTMLVRRQKIDPNAFKLIKECVAKAMTEPEFTNELKATVLDDDKYFTELLCKGRLTTMEERKQIRDLVQELISNTFVVVDETDTGYVMHFGLERFYDYFIGNYLSSSTDDEEKLFSLLQDIGIKLPEKPFLWGPACRIVELKLCDVLKPSPSKTYHKEKYPLVRKMLEWTDESIQEVVTAAFVDVFAKYPDNTVTFIEDVIADYRKRGGAMYWETVGKNSQTAEKTKRLLGIVYRIVLSEDQARLDGKKIDSITRIFKSAIMDFSSDVRYIALTFLYHLNNEHSYLVDHVATELNTELVANAPLSAFFVAPKIIRFGNIIRGVAMLSVFRWGRGFFEELQNQTMDKDSFHKSVVQFKEILQKIYEPQKRFDKLRKFVVKSLFQLFIKHQIIKTYKDKDNPCNFYEMEVLLKEIKRNQVLKQQVQQIARFFDTSQSDITQNQDEMIQLCNISNGLTSWYLYSIIPLHFKIPNRQEKVLKLIKTLCRDGNCNSVAKLIGLNALLTLITRMPDVVKDKNRQGELMALFMSTAHNYILETGAYTNFKLSPGNGGTHLGRQWANSVPGEYHLLKKYNESFGAEESKESSLLSILLKKGASDEDWLKCTEIVCNFVIISDVFKMTDAALEELRHLVKMLENHTLETSYKAKIEELVSDALKQIKAHDPARAVHFVDNYLTKSNLLKKLEKIKFESTESTALHRTVGIIGNSVYQNVFLMYDEVATMFSKATLRAIEKKRVRSFFQIYIDEVSSWAQNQLKTP